MLTSFVPGLMMDRGMTRVCPVSACTTPKKS